MLKNVKSIYFLRFIFSLVDEKQKLELIKYNKSLQENLNVTLINYKYFSGKYIEYELNGKGKEYNFDGELIFEGEYLNGKRNGKGKEYYNNGKLEYEGEYLLNNKYNGKGYGEKGNIIYELKNGTGKVKEYLGDILVFEGEYLNGLRNGKGNMNMVI